MKPIVLAILDGWGSSWWKRNNSIKLAHTPAIDDLERNWPNTLLKAAGAEIGLPKGCKGNSEDGHVTIGSGRVVQQRISRINQAIADHTFADNHAFMQCIKKNHVVHLIGLLSDAKVESDITHVEALIRVCKTYDTKVYVHAILDGLDSQNTKGKKVVARLSRALRGIGEIATISGRSYALDRTGDWVKTHLVYKVLFAQQNVKIYYKNAIDAVSDNYKKKVYDSDISPQIIGDYDGMKEGEGVVFFNYAAQGIKQLYQSIVMKDWTHFAKLFVPLNIVTMTEYEPVLTPVAFPPPVIPNVLGEVLSDANMNQLYISESLKSKHMSYFFNGLRDTPFSHQEHVVIQTPKVRTYDLLPELAAKEVCQQAIAKMSDYSVIVLNFANPDIVGHTGVLSQTVRACEIVDECVSALKDAVSAVNGTLIVTSDHGNCEDVSGVYDESDNAHTTNPVPFYLFNKKHPLRKRGTLSDIAPTVLDLLGIDIPKEMTGETLLMKI